MNVNTIQKCHRVCKAEVSPPGASVARLSGPETANIAGLKSLAGLMFGITSMLSYMYGRAVM
ncbi:hypothetical protein, partial [Litoreibacter roseus]|uniref:hypothetical protein n=1 Tax=Litoreibacter roseus TaxID=2601869 RepID=UPI001A9A9EA9